MTALGDAPDGFTLIVLPHQFRLRVKSYGIAGKHFTVVDCVVRYGDAGHFTLFTVDDTEFHVTGFN